MICHFMLSKEGAWVGRGWVGGGGWIVKAVVTTLNPKHVVNMVTVETLFKYRNKGIQFSSIDIHQFDIKNSDISVVW